jgi:putative methanogen marker protein 4
MIIGIGVAQDQQKVIASITALNGVAEVVCYTSGDLPPSPLYRVERSESPEYALINDLRDGVIDAAVRGSLPANATLGLLRTVMQVEHLERIALLETVSGQKFLLAPVGVDEGWTIAQRVALVEKARKIAGRFGLSSEVAVLSGGRYGDVGRHPIVDQSLAAGELVAKVAGAIHYEIRIEDAVESCGVVIAPDGIAGNLIFRTLSFLGGGKGHGAPVVNIDKIFIDTSRASPDYTNALLLAVSMFDW